MLGGAFLLLPCQLVSTLTWAVTNQSPISQHFHHKTLNQVFKTPNLTVFNLHIHKFIVCINSLVGLYFISCFLKKVKTSSFIFKQHEVLPLSHIIFVYFPKLSRFFKSKGLILKVDTIIIPILKMQKQSQECNNLPKIIKKKKKINA